MDQGTRVQSLNRSWFVGGGSDLRPHCAEQHWPSHGFIQQDVFPQSRGFEQPKIQCTSLVKPLSLTKGFAAHKYLLIAIVECLQKMHARRPIRSPEQRSHPAVHRWMREPSAQREHTTCSVMREHHDRGDLSVAQVALEHKSQELPSLVEWMRQQVPALRYPDQDTLHMALAPTLPARPRRLSDRIRLN